MCLLEHISGRYSQHLTKKMSLYIKQYGRPKTRHLLNFDYNDFVLYIDKVSKSCIINSY